MVPWSWINCQVRGVLLVWIRVGQGPTALAVGAGGGCLDIFTLIYPFSFLSPSLWETTRYRLKYCLKGSLSSKTTNQPIGPSPREREKGAKNKRREKKMSKQRPPSPTASAVGPCPTTIEMSRTPRHWKFTQHHRTTDPTTPYALSLLTTNFIA